MQLPRGWHDNMGTTFGRAALTKFARAKNVQNSARYQTTFNFDREYISGMDRHDKNLISALSTTTPPTLGEITLMNFGPLTKIIGVPTHPSGLFHQVDIFHHLSLGSVAPQILHMYFQSDLRCRVASSWALSHISSTCYEPQMSTVSYVALQSE